jgi:hypothetical protein
MQKFITVEVYGEALDPKDTRFDTRNAIPFDPDDDDGTDVDPWLRYLVEATPENDRQTRRLAHFFRRTPKYGNLIRVTPGRTFDVLDACILDDGSYNLYRHIIGQLAMADVTRIQLSTDICKRLACLQTYLDGLHAQSSKVHIRQLNNERLACMMRRAALAMGTINDQDDMLADRPLGRMPEVYGQYMYKAIQLMADLRKQDRIVKRVVKQKKKICICVGKH